MLYRQKLEPCCACCTSARPISSDAAVCLRRGIVSLSGCCRKFSYDPLKRIPEAPRTLVRKEHSPEEFEL